MSTIVRTAEEIDEQIRRGEIWTEKHPRSFFGDDNKAQFRVTRAVLELAKARKSFSEIEEQIEQLSDEDYSAANKALSWLSGDEEEIYSKE